MTTLALRHPYHPFTRAVNTGTSPEARSLQKTIETMVAHFRSRVEQQTAFADLAHLLANTSKANWDQYDAAPLTLDAYYLALRFLIALPATLPAPEVGLDPDGEVSFEWANGPEKIFTVSANAKGRLSYAGLFGEGITTHGTEVFDDTIPQTVIQCVERVASQANGVNRAR
ncbi:MAG: hypothetical protein ACM3SS_19585 [Rhodospirillaceae bacterium]